MPPHLFFFYATIILLPTQFGYHFWPDWALVLGRRLDYLSPTVFSTDITIMLTLISWLFSSFSSLKINNFRFIKNFELKIKNYWKFVAFVGFVVLNIFFATSPLVAFSKWLKILEFVLFGFYIVKTKPSFSRSLWCLSIAVFYSSIIAIAQFFLQHSVGGLLWFLGERTFDITTPGIARIQLLLPSLFPALPAGGRLPSSEYLRPYATFPHPNVLGGFLAVTLPLIISQSTNLLINKSTNRLIKIFLYSTLFFGILTLILTFSRSAWVAGIIGLFILLFLHFRSVKNYLFARRSFSVGGVVFIGFVGLFFVLPYFQSLTLENESVFVRNELNSASINMIVPNFRFPSSDFRHLFFGVGLGNFLVELPKYYPHREIFFLQPVHNIYLLILSETGIIGLTVCLYLLFLMIKIILSKQQKKYSLYLFISLSLYLILGFVDHYPLTLQQGQLLLTILISFNLLLRPPTCPPKFS